MEKNKFTHGSLFSGIGGPEIAAEEMGWKNMFHCEINPFGRKILDYWFPNSKSYEDITKTNFTEWRGKINVLTGGFPCQPFSCAGQRKGAEDDRYLWPEMLRAIREIQPDWVVGENVAGILSMVQPGSETALGREESLFGEVDRKRILHRQEYVVETVCNDLEREGYFVQPVVIPACAVGAPHRRDRVFFIAHRADAGVKGMQRKWEDNILSGRTASDTTCRGSGGTPHESCCENERQNGYETQQPFVRGCVRASSHSDGERCNNRSDNWKERPICYDQKRDSEENQSERTERMRRTCENGSVASYSQCPGSGQVQQEIQSEQSNGHSFDSNGGEWDAPYSSSEGLSTLRFPTSIEKKKWENEDGCSVQPAGNVRRASFAERWKNFPTQSPVCLPARGKRLFGADELDAELCIKDGMNYQIAEIHLGDVESSNILCEEIARRWNEHEEWHECKEDTEDVPPIGTYCILRVEYLCCSNKWKVDYLTAYYNKYGWTEDYLDQITCNYKDYKITHWKPINKPKGVEE
jgi:DNA (cytosine-5)-methyltransferase 1